MGAISEYRGDWLVFAGNYGAAAEEMIRLLVFRPETGVFEQVGAAGGIDNPSFLAFDGKRELLYAVSETDDGYAVAYRFDRQAMTLREINRQPVHGSAACHLFIDEPQRLLHVANYSSGNYAVLPIRDDGGLAPLSGLAQHEGHGVNPERQEKAHVHSVFPDPSGRYVLVCDLGIDKILVYETGGDGQPAKVGEIEAPAGSGPRHLAFHPAEPWLYVLGELSSQVLVYAYDADARGAELLQTADMLPADYSGMNIAADIHIHPSGRWLYASNRGHDSLAVYAVGEDGRLTARGHVPTGGQTPRNFAVLPDGRHLLAANQDSGTVVPFRIGADGIPVQYGTPFALPKPVCVVPVPLG